MDGLALAPGAGTPAFAPDVGIGHLKETRHAADRDGQVLQ